VLPTPAVRPARGSLKRAVDLLVSLPGLLLLALPLLLIALAVKLDSRGPVFYRQLRVGRHGVPFRIHKFRTMAHDPQGGADEVVPQITVGADPRITRVGALLRRRKLDELPQLIDVLQGSMSLVGPRPEVPRYVAMYPPELRAKVLSVRPGITDPASLAFRNESDLLARAADPEREYVQVLMPRKLALAAHYAETASLGTDLKIVWRTLRLLLAGR
jgi:lipopolysaccharide/colanic/teichoic acid biosynthesis glycosyltransferase